MTRRVCHHMPADQEKFTDSLPDFIGSYPPRIDSIVTSAAF